MKENPGHAARQVEPDRSFDLGAYPYTELELKIKSAQEVREQFRADRDRPRYHFLPHESWMNDINGPIFYKGRHHIFFQYNPVGGFHKYIHWGHASSTDLVHWVQHPPALAPEPGSYDQNGIFSGCLFMDKQGVPTIMYHTPLPCDGICLAQSHDDMLIAWTKSPGNPVIPKPNPDDECYTLYGSPSTWIEDGMYYAIVGNDRWSANMRGRPDEAWLFRSHDLLDWEYMHPFYQGGAFTEPGEDCAVPNFFQLGEKHVLLFASHKLGTQYYIGNYRDKKFYPERHGRWSWHGGQLAGPNSFADGQSRRIYVDWINEARPMEAAKERGWSGVMSLPKILTLTEDHRLGIAPVPELEALRYNRRARRNCPVRSETVLWMEEIRGDCLELALEIDRQDADEFGVKVRCSPDGQEETVIAIRPADQSISIVTSKSSLHEDVVYLQYFSPIKQFIDVPAVERQEAPLEFGRDDPLLRLRIFLDRSVLEVFANERQCLTSRIYPSRADSLGVGMYSMGGNINVLSIEAWDMADTHC